MPLDPFQSREVFHLAFLRSLSRAVPPSSFVLKGGSNLRFFFGSVRYSEDMDLDLARIPVHLLQDKVMAILASPHFGETLRTYGVERVQAPDISTQKQTSTVQRFKVHLHTTGGLDLFTKVEFSRRGLEAPCRAEPVSADVLSRYKMASLIVPHYEAEAATRQKIHALHARNEPQARDVFDLFTLRSHSEGVAGAVVRSFTAEQLNEARERVFSISYEEYRSKVIDYLDGEDQLAFASPDVWDAIRLHAVGLLEMGMAGDA